MVLNSGLRLVGCHGPRSIAAGSGDDRCREAVGELCWARSPTTMPASDSSANTPLVTALDELTDVELVRVAELPTDRLGCWLWLSPVAFGTLLGVTLDAPSAAFGFAAALAAAWLASRIRARSPRRQQAKLAEQALAQRYCTMPIERYLPAAQAALRDDPALQAVLLLSGTGLPHGGRHFIRVELGASSRVRLRTLPFLHDLRDAADPAERMLSRDLPLTAASVERLHALLDALDPLKLAPPTAPVHDGFPCSALVIRRAGEPLRIDVNLSGLDGEQQKHPSAQLLLCLLELEDLHAHTG